MEIYQGKQYHRVTEILSSLTKYKEIPDFVLTKAKERGETLHKVIECDLNDLGMYYDVKYQKYIDSYKKFNMPGKAVLVEHRFYNEDYMITGKCDCIAYDEEMKEYILLDWKFTYQEGKTWELQAAAYGWLAQQQGYDIKRIMFVRLDKKGGEPEVFNYEYKPEEFFMQFHSYLESLKTCGHKEAA